jgi:predicted DsbA family dithiol-disulfide isomerase
MSEASSDEKLVIYSDYLCPFCYLGKASLEAYLETADESPEVEWRPFDIQGAKRGPDGEIEQGVDDGKDEAYFERAKQNVERLKEEYGVEMSWDLPDGIDSWHAQKVALAVERSYDRETFQGFHQALFEALWREGRDIGDAEVLAEVADEHGIDPADVREAVDDDELDGELSDRFTEAHRRGVRGIPAFIYGEYIAQGAIPPEQFGRLLAQE